MQCGNKYLLCRRTKEPSVRATHTGSKQACPAGTESGEKWCHEVKLALKAFVTPWGSRPSGICPGFMALRNKPVVGNTTRGVHAPFPSTSPPYQPGHDLMVSGMVMVLLTVIQAWCWAHTIHWVRQTQPRLGACFSQVCWVTGVQQKVSTFYVTQK